MQICVSNDGDADMPPNKRKKKIKYDEDKYLEDEEEKLELFGP